MIPQPQQTDNFYRITRWDLEEYYDAIAHINGKPEADRMWERIERNARTSRPAPSPERIGSIRTNVFMDDQKEWLIERVNAGMGEWEYVILNLGEYYATAPSEEIARSIVEMATHTCPVFTPQHDTRTSRPAPSPRLNTQPKGTTCEDCQRFRTKECPYPESNITITKCNSFMIDLESHDTAISAQARKKVLDGIYGHMNYLSINALTYKDWCNEIKKYVESLRTGGEPR